MFNVIIHSGNVNQNLNEIVLFNLLGHYIKAKQNKTNPS